MMQKVAVAAVFFLTAFANASPQIEVGAGLTQATTAGNGTWYQEGFPYQLHLRSRSWFVGVTDKLDAPQVFDGKLDAAWHLQYVNLGIYRADAIATTDENYNRQNSPPCNGPCVAQSRFVGNGTASGVAATYELKTQGDVQFGIEAGPYLFRPIWRETVYNWTVSRYVPGITIQYANPEKLKLGAVFGISTTRGPWGVSMRHYLNKCTPSADACLWHSITTVNVFFRFGD